MVKSFSLPSFSSLIQSVNNRGDSSATSPTRLPTTSGVSPSLTTLPSPFSPVSPFDLTAAATTPTGGALANSLLNAPQAQSHHLLPPFAPPILTTASMTTSSPRRPNTTESFIGNCFGSAVSPNSRAPTTLLIPPLSPTVIPSTTHSPYAVSSPPSSSSPPRGAQPSFRLKSPNSPIVVPSSPFNASVNHNPQSHHHQHQHQNHNHSHRSPPPATVIHKDAPLFGSNNTIHIKIPSPPHLYIPDISTSISHHPSPQQQQQQQQQTQLQEQQPLQYQPVTTTTPSPLGSFAVDNTNTSVGSVVQQAFPAQSSPQQQVAPTVRIFSPLHATTQAPIILPSSTEMMMTDEPSYVEELQPTSSFGELGTLGVGEGMSSGDRSSSSFACPQCDRIFVRKGDLNSHMRTHTGERPYVCLDCSKTFTTNSNLRRHQRIHLNKKPYVCDVCQKAFRQLSHLKRHKSSIHHRRDSSSSTYSSGSGSDSSSSLLGSSL